MKIVITDGKAEQQLQRLLRMIAVLRDPGVMMTVASVKDELAAGRKDIAAEGYAELELDAIRALWVAPSKGGIWTTSERRMMTHDAEWRALVEHYREDDWHEENTL